MTDAEPRDLDAALRRAAAADVASAAVDATRAAMETAERLGLVDVAVGRVESPVGELFVAVSDRGVVRIAFDLDEPSRVLDELAARVSPRVAETRGRVDTVRRQLDEYFARRRRVFDLDVDLALTSAFGRRVLRQAARIPAGRVQTYGELAARVGSPRAARAVGNALGANPVPIVMPCHRVVPASGGYGKYGGGTERKAFLIELERG
jgi:methylated-DNA-[protein]-cysteine S-methyltransferase